ncbi:carboxypeptidase-like regulatory domain-containing protein [Hymenobacter armeniacus]|uniref:Carboxypeptidase-like regulatory domain-containing protein n=1 Tax=Hymenobacter armeniacus TaxID=2771358 RepID=A0ABR8JW73_9BACT|nr:carboxypeptidase-like regulatory domain-containing protein [Hymenobacter armeniacus]MBD2723046.1 carboxypeptidase-like regulatory domain-containing protein [Hymenobacter armeniacus]
MRPTVSLTIPQPCHESWDAMTPAAQGRHCAACQKTVVDFTLKTDAEILAHLATAASGVCGRVWDNQLTRPLAPLGPSAVPARWRTWAATALVAWGLREGLTGGALAQTPAAGHAPHSRKKAGAAAPALLIQGVVLNVTTGAPLPGAAVFLQGENRRTTADSAGRFSLRVPAGRRARHSLVVHLFGYQSQTAAVPATVQARSYVPIGLRADAAATGVEVAAAMPVVQQRTIWMGSISAVSATELLPLARTPGQRVRSLLKWLTKPFRRPSTN